MNNLNKNIKIFFMDLDGTALDIKVGKHRDISQKNIEEIHKTMQNTPIVISTGRLGHNAERFIKKTKVDYAILGSGSQIVDKNGKILWEKKLSSKQVESLIKIAKKYKLVFKLDDQKQTFGNSNKFLKFITNSLRLGYVAHKLYNVEIKDYYKFLFWGKNKWQNLKILKDMNKIVPNISAVTTLNGWIIEVTHKNATKGIANEYVAKNIYKIKDKNQIAHIGDTMNDSTVIGYVGRLIVMKNASKKLKKMSNYEGPSYKNGGLAKILQGKYKNKK